MQNLPQIENRLKEKLRAGINIYRQISCPLPQPLLDFIRQKLPDIKASHAAALPSGFANSRRLYKSFHIDPTKHRPSSEALWRRLRDRNDFPDVNPAVNLTNLLSLKFQICYGLYDLARVQGNIIIILGEKNDCYQGIRKEILYFQGKIVLRDAQGAFGNPSADSLRASVNENSRDIMLVLFFHPCDHLKEKILDETQAMYRQFFSIGEVQSFFI
jgi:DNA/RNA-binding domain of Phe-tRNA-synthetase-like protein